MTTRDQTIEECAQIASAKAQVWRDLCGSTLWARGVAAEFDQLANDILALKSSPPTDPAALVPVQQGVEDGDNRYLDAAGRVRTRKSTVSSTPPVHETVLVDAEREVIALEARRYASHYPEASDGRNTFVMLAEWIEARAALAQPVESWKPIETAPKDGTWFIAYRPRAGGFCKWDRVLIVKWSDEISDFIWPDEVYDVYGDDPFDVSEAYESIGSFTHWIPLPKPPSQGER